jgi:hypothetical protein
MSAPAEFERLEQHLRGSSLVRVADRLAASSVAAGTRSAFAGRLHRVRSEWTAVAAARRTRGVAVFAATAATAHLLFLRFVPAQAAPALPWMIWVLVAAAALTVAALAGRVVLAWDSSIARRAMVTLTGSPFPESRK